MKTRRGSSQPPAEDPPLTARAFRIVVADDHVFLRELVVAMLARRPRYEIVAQTSTAEDAIEACRSLSPDLLILDINLPGMSGLEAVPKIRQVSPATRILLFSGSVSEAGIVAALRSGADGFMEKTESRAVFLEAVERVAHGEHYFCGRSSRLLSDMAQGRHQGAAGEGVAALTQREGEVLSLIAAGRTNKEIAAKLHLSVRTVDTHRANLMRKLGARNAAELTRYALKNEQQPWISSNSA